MRFYVASSLENADRVRQIRDKLLVFDWQLTYDWTEHGPVRYDPARMMLVCDAEIHGVLSSDVFILLLPGGRGAHVELGLAMSSPARRIALWSPDPDTDFGRGPKTSLFYHRRNVWHMRCPFEKLDEAILDIMPLSGMVAR